MKRWLGLPYLLMVALALQACAGWNQQKYAETCGSPQAEAVTPRKDAPVVIVGAGLTGLTIAYKLKEAGIPSLLVEASPRVGGRIQTVTFVDGATAEAHMEEYFEHNPAVNLLRELGLELHWDLPHSTVRIDGRIYPYQGRGARDEYLAGIFNAEERAAFMKWNEKAWGIYSKLDASRYAGQPLPPELADLMRISFEEFVGRDKLPRKVSEWIRVTVEPEMAIEWDKISALDGIDEFRLFLDTPKGFGEKNYHVEGGNTEFTKALASRLSPEQIMTQARVTAIEQTDAGVKLRILEKECRYIEVTGRMAVVTVPVNHIGRIQFSPQLSAEKWKAINTTRMGSYVKVHFRVAPEGAALWRDKSILTMVSDTQAGSIYDVTKLQGNSAEDRDRVLTLLLHAGFARDLMNLPLDEVREKSAEALDNLIPGVRKHIKSAEIFVYPQAVAYWPLELGRSRFDALANELRRPQGRIYFGGDTTVDSHSEGAVISAFDISRQLLERRAELK
jgi:monoamine oxidase